VASFFGETRAWITRRRAEIDNEVELLTALKTPRSTLFLQATAKVTDQAVATTNTYTTGESLRTTFTDRISEILTSSTPSAINTTSSIVAQDPLTLFLNEALVLLGLILKSNTSEVVNGLLRTAAKELHDTASDIIDKAGETQALLAELATRPLGQGASFPPNSPAAIGLERDLASAKDAADRLLANTGGLASISSALAQGVRASLQSALNTLIADAPTLTDTLTLTNSLVAAGPSLDTLSKSMSKNRQNLSTFREHYEASFRGVSADRAQAAGLSSNVGAILEQVQAAQTTLSDLAPFRQAWMQEIAVLIALSRESKGESPQSIFTLDTGLADTYTAFKGQIDQVPDTDLSQLSADLSSIQGFLIGVGTSIFAEQMQILVTRSQANLTLIRDRAQALVTAVDAHPFLPSALVTQLLSMVTGARVQTALDALQSGDILGFLQLSLGSLNPVDLIKTEIQSFADSGLAQKTNLVDDISFAFQGIITFEQNDIIAEQGFEQARSQTIANLQSDLAQLDRIELLLDKAEAL
jgi:hypothetical protein